MKFATRRLSRNLMIIIAFICLLTVKADAIEIPDGIEYGFPVERCYQFMKILIDEFGATPEGAAAVCGNAAQESMFNPYAQAPAGYIGIFQWSSSRWASISAWLDSNGRGSSDDEYAYSQLRATFSRAENGVYMDWTNETVDPIDYICSTSSISDAVHYWLVVYEGAGGQEESQRIAYAEKALAIYNAN